MDVKNLTVIETKADMTLVRLDFHHTRGDTMLYAVVVGQITNPINIQESDIRFFLTMRVGSLALEQLSKASATRSELDGPIIGKSYEQMLAILEKQV